MKFTRSVALALPALAALGAQTMFPATSAAQRTPAAMSAIRQADIKRDIDALAGDEMRGREAGTLDEMQASMWIAEQMRTIGLTPHGDTGSWFQWFNMRRTRISTTASSIQSGSRTVVLWADITPAPNAAGDIVGPMIFIGDGSDTTVNIRGRIVVATMDGGETRTCCHSASAHVAQHCFRVLAVLRACGR